MTIYERPVRLLMRDMVRDLRLGPADILTRDQAIEWFKAKYPKIKPGTIAAHLIRMSTNAPNRVHFNANRSGEDDLFFQLDSRRFRLYNPNNDPPPIYDKGAAGEPMFAQPATDEQDAEAEMRGSEFAYEKDLQSFLAKNLALLEPGLRLYEDEGITGVEFPGGGRTIDLLALDKDNRFAVIELKVSRGYDRVVGQVLRYMAWIRQNLADAGQGVRGVIVAREILEGLKLAASLVPGIELYEYQMSVSLSRVEPSGSDGAQGRG